MGRDVSRFGRADEMSQRERALAQARRIARPVKLLALIERLDGWQIDNDVMTAVMEAAESGVDIDAIYEGPQADLSEGTREEEEERLTAPESASAIGVYRLGGGGVTIHFGKDGRPASPPTDFLFYSRLDSERCFGCELHSDKMVADAPPYFRMGDVLIFSTDAKPQSGDFVFVKTREGDDLCQVFFGKDEQVRLRPLNPKYPEQTYKRSEVRDMCKLIARYQAL